MNRCSAAMETRPNGSTAESLDFRPARCRGAGRMAILLPHSADDRPAEAVEGQAVGYGDRFPVAHNRTDRRLSGTPRLLLADAGGRVVRWHSPRNIRAAC